MKLLIHRMLKYEGSNEGDTKRAFIAFILSGPFYEGNVGNMKAKNACLHSCLHIASPLFISICAYYEGNEGKNTYKYYFMLELLVDVYRSCCVKIIKLLNYSEINLGKTILTDFSGHK